MGFIDGLFKNVGNAVTGGLAGAAGNFVSGLFSDKDNPKEIMELQNQLEKERMKYQSDLNEIAADRNQQRALDYFIKQQNTTIQKTREEGWKKQGSTSD